MILTRYCFFIFLSFFIEIGALSASLNKVNVTSEEPRPIFPVELRENSKSNSIPKARIPYLGKTDRQLLMNSWRLNPWSERNFLVYELTAQQDMSWWGGGQQYEVLNGETVLVYITFPVSLENLFTHDHRIIDPLAPLLTDDSKLKFSLYAPEGFTAPSLIDALLSEENRVHRINYSETNLPEEITIEKRLPSNYFWANLLADLAVG